ncbi:hypothetical protein JW766_06805 [Candidatus Dojkabacteria bacterium]|nr:hypothetical protein [Candidatus Dojkabacteria bacterium]
MQKKSINLLQKRGAPPTFWERLYDWMTNTCRVIIIVVEVLVLGAFGWRFWLDRRLNDLKDDIELKGDVLKSLSDDEAEIRLIQTKISTYKEIINISSNLTPILKEVNDYIPTDTEDLAVSISNTRDGKIFSISGEIEREKIDVLENQLKDSETFSDVTLTEIEKRQARGDKYTFTLSARIIFNQPRTIQGTDEGTESETGGAF